MYICVRGGTGSGYQAAILAHLTRRVYTVDRHRRLVAEAQVLFRDLGLVNIVAMVADGSYGLPDQAPFTASLSPPPPKTRPGPLVEPIGGIMVVPVGQSDTVIHLIRLPQMSAVMHYGTAPGALCPACRRLGQ